MADDREKAARWAGDLLARSDWVILDTETTGLSESDEIIQIAVISPDGSTLFEELIRPTRPIPPDSTQIHGICDEDVGEAPAFPDVLERLNLTVEGKTIVIFNAAFDLRLFRQTASRHGLKNPLAEGRTECGMIRYSAWCGERWPGGGYKWQRLPGGDHTAVGDCQAVLRLIRTMASGS